MVDGTLNATNTTFTSSGTSWGGIQFRSGSSGNLNGCIIENVSTYGGAAISIIGGYASVQNCTIEDNTNSHGIYISGTSNAPYLYNNIIRDNDLSGIYIYNGNAYLRYNTITGSSSSSHAAVRCDYFSTPLFAAPSGGYEEGRNTLRNGYHGLWGSYHCLINAGSSANGYNNTFSNNTYANVRASSYTTISAEYNWWSPNPPSRVIADGTSSIDYSPYNQWQDEITTGNSKNSIGENSITSSNSLSEARAFLFQKDYQNAFDIYKQIINSKTNESDIKNSLSDLYFLYREQKMSEIITVIESVASLKEDANDYKPIALEVLSNIALINDTKSEFLKYNSELRTSYKNSIHELHGITDLFYYYFNNSDYEKSLATINSVPSKFEVNENINFAKWLVSSQLGLDGIMLPKNNDGLISEEKISTEYELFENYPNPFNPSTTITFSLPQQEKVELIVYDILGRKVAELVSEMMEAGKYNIDFDGSELSSGTYIYKIIAGSFTESKKMLLVK